MSLDHLLSAIDAEITRLQQARELLAGTGTGKRANNFTTAAPLKSKRVRRKRTLSPEARKRIADAQRKRWAAQKKSTPAAK